MNRLRPLTKDELLENRSCRYAHKPKCQGAATHLLESITYRYDRPGKEIMKPFYVCRYHYQFHIDQAQKYKRKIEISTEGAPGNG